MRYIIGFIWLMATLNIGCKKSTDKPAALPQKASLLFPSKDQPCTSATEMNETHSTIGFNWNRSENTDSYELVVKDLNTGESTSKATAATNLEIRLKRNTPFAWYVTSKSDKVSTTANSDVWKFYNPGPGAQSVAPYPAEIISPGIGQHLNVVNGKITFHWSGSDADGDIIGYDLYFGTDRIPALFKTNISAIQLADVPVNSNTTYYWNIITKDARGNKSNSGVYLFRVN